jgi:hypothetical protein
MILLLGAAAGCGGRPAAGADSGTASSDQLARSDRLLAPDRRTPVADAAAARTCSSLKLVGQTSLELADTMKLGPQVVFDGERFALIWHSQPGYVSSLNGELRFALVDAAGKTETPAGLVLGSDDGSLRAALGTSAIHAGQYAVARRPVSPTCHLEYSRIDAKGKVAGGGLCIAGQFNQAALSPHPTGQALFLAEQSGVPRLLVVDTASPPPGKILGSNQVMASLWLAPRPGGFAAAWATTNSNSELFLLDQSFALLKTTKVGHGKVKHPSFAVLPDGLAAVYAVAGSLASPIESEIYDAAGQPLAHQQVALRGDYVATTDETALSWTGSQLVAVYSAPVSGRYTVRLLDAGGKPAGDPVPVPNCLATARDLAAAWGKDRLAVVTINEASGVMQTSVCVTLMGCI